MLAKLFSNKLLPVYAGAWLVIAFVHYTILRFQLHINEVWSVSEALVFNAVFALLGIGLWYLVKFSDYEKLNSQEMILRHVTSGTVTMLILFGSVYLIMGAVSGNDAEYMALFNETMMVKVFAGLMLYIIMITVFYLLINNQNLKERRAREAALQNLLHESELNSLRAQIKPHFLFNSLNSISSLTITNPEKAQEMVINLSEFMRYSLSFSDNKMSSLKQELYHLRLYLDIEKVRFGGRLMITESFEDGILDWPLPPMILQPLVENAVKHGVYDTPGQSFIKIEGSKNNGWLEIVVSNNFDPAMPRKRGTGTGLANVMKRMQMVYGISTLAKISKNENMFEVKLKFPGNDKNKNPDH
ncbi:MAG: histidine kinase [Lentimicrobiaceae bacterium]|nr:histidine kinase [Lentimicrobiaceae bacterium]HPG34414.1 histidine kinase [Lentimicrobium sp.]